MSRQKVKFEKKYISRQTLLKKLDLTMPEFEKLCVLTNTLPCKAKAHQCTDNLDTVFYSIKSAKEMINSDTFLDLNRITRLLSKRNEFKNLKRYKKDVCIDYDTLVINKYTNLDSALSAIPFSVKLVGLKQRMCEKDNSAAKTDGLCDFFDILETHFELITVFLGSNGFYFSTTLLGKVINFFLPYKIEVSHTNNVFETLFPLCNTHLILISRKIRESMVAIDRNLVKKGVIKIESIYYQVYRLISIKIGYEVSVSNYQFIVTDEFSNKMENNVYYVHPQFLVDSISKQRNFKDYLWGVDLPKQEECIFQKNDILENKNIECTQSKSTAFKMLD